MTGAVRAAGPRLADSWPLGRWTGRLAATSVVTGCGTAGAGGRSAAGCVGSTPGTTGAATGEVVGGVGVVGIVGIVGVVGETTLGGDATSELPDALGTGTSGSEIGKEESLAGSQVEAGV